ncbi:MULTISPECIES: MFS transporter [unclassified Janthinobacterium]|jgi:MFS family permease|uniref:MFS transporter n=1 Tax=unclassified Janthinobacterium TaxID=2610881 RepID=UPI001616F848|nr:MULTISPECIES: MFS transporter [unclassified Janthinobacterium]MBB5609289.1 MFS family permease [Janthinobacterium sp. S3T4]MBB5614462.1 MFS family permease [Janthinobacterium sp. S3M3]
MNTQVLSKKDGDGHFSWYHALTGKERRTFWSCKAGYGLDAMDTQFLSFVIPTLIATWGLSKSDAGLIGTVTLLTSAIGGWLAGILSDRIGRVKALQITILWFAFFTVLCGLAQNYTQLLWARGLMGFGMGGEWTAGAILMGEVIRAKDRGKAVGMVQSGWALGWGVSAMLYALMFSLLPPEWAWRALFLLGVLPALFVIFIRRFVDEPEVFLAQQAVPNKDQASFWQIFSPKMISVTLRAVLLTTGAQGGYYAITTWLPTYLKTERHLTVLGTGGYLAMVIAGSYVGYIISAFLTDYLGRKKNFILFGFGSMCVALIYTRVPVTDGVMLFLGFPLGFFVSGVFSGMGAFLTELFPTAIRGSGQGFSYNMGRAVGALFPLLIGMSSQTMALGASIGVFAGVAYGVMILAALTLPETAGKQLES